MSVPWISARFICFQKSSAARCSWPTNEIRTPELTRTTISIVEQRIGFFLPLVKRPRLAFTFSLRDL